MTSTACRPVVSDLPGTLPVFPLSGVLLLPQGHLPLNIFEPRYKSMVDDALKTSRLIGMIQPREKEKTDNESAPPLFDTGCAGRITSFDELTDGRYRITLTGICRFRVESELPQECSYRRVQPDWAPFIKDCDDIPHDLGINRPLLRNLLGNYFDQHDLNCDWDAIDGATDDGLVTCLAMICPLEPGEKQALLETVCHMERANKFMALLSMAVQNGGCGKGCH